MFRRNWIMWVCVGLGLGFATWGLLAGNGILFGAGVGCTGVLLYTVWWSERQRKKREAQLASLTTGSAITSQMSTQVMQQMHNFLTHAFITSTSTTPELAKDIKELANTPSDKGNSWMGTNAAAEWTNIPILGWRTWSLQAGIFNFAPLPFDPPRPKSKGLLPHGGHGQAWPTPNHTAVCERPQEQAGALADKPIPHTNQLCSGCGIYASKEASPAVDGVVGIVALTGRVLEGEKGYRASEAEVLVSVVREQDEWRWVRDWERMANPVCRRMRVPKLSDAAHAFAYALGEVELDATSHTLEYTLEEQWDDGLGEVIGDGHDGNQAYETMLAHTATILHERGFFGELHEAVKYVQESLNG